MSAIYIIAIGISFYISLGIVISSIGVIFMNDLLGINDGADFIQGVVFWPIVLFLELVSIFSILFYVISKKIDGYVNWLKKKGKK